MKTCPRCKTNLAVTKFGRRSSGRPTAYCRTCTTEYDREYRSRHYSRIRKQRRQSLYGLTDVEYQRLLESQKHMCASCGDKLQPEQQGLRTIHVDHSHETGQVRGLLCKHCNLALGHLKDNPVRVQKLLEYLQ